MTPRQKMVVGILAVVVVAMLIGVLAFAGRSSKTEPTGGGAPTGGATNGGGASTGGGSPPASKEPAPANSPAVPAVPAQTAPTGPEYLLGKKYTDLQSADPCPAGYAAIDDKAECDKAMNALKPGIWFFARGTPGNTADVPEDLDDLKTLGGRVGSAGMAKGCSYVRMDTNPNYEQYYFNSDTGKTSEYAYGTKGGLYVTPFCKRV